MSKELRLRIHKIFVRPEELLHFLLSEVAAPDVVELNELRDSELFTPRNIVWMEE